GRLPGDHRRPERNDPLLSRYSHSSRYYRQSFPQNLMVVPELLKNPVLRIVPIRRTCGSERGCGKQRLKRNTRKSWSNRKGIGTGNSAIPARQGRCRTMLPRRFLFLTGLVVLLGPTGLFAAAPPPAPPAPAYQIVLRSRQADVAPTRAKEAQTGGGSIVVEQPDLNTIIVTMGGSAVVGSDCHGSVAAMEFNLEQ